MAGTRADKPSMSRRARVVTIALAVVMALGIGAFAVYRWVIDSIDDAIPGADLLGPTLTASAGPRAGHDITGPLNFLILGQDTRVSSNSAPHSDSIMIMHVNADLSHAYLTSLPRDLVVDVPAFAPSGSRAQRTKITNAMSLGARVPGSNQWNMAQGFQLVSQAARGYTGIEDFDAGAVIGFGGLRDFIDEIGGIELYVDHRVVSIHREPSGRHRKSCDSCPNGYGGPQMVYEVGLQRLNGWQTLDYARQRYGLPDGAYSRERHHRQIIVAIIAALYEQNLVLNPKAFRQILSTVGDGLVFDGRGRKPTDFGYALRNIGPEDITLIGLPGHGVYTDGAYAGEALDEATKNAYFRALRNDTLDQFVAAHPTLVNRTSP